MTVGSKPCFDEVSLEPDANEIAEHHRIGRIAHEVGRRSVLAVAHGVDHPVGHARGAEDLHRRFARSRGKRAGIPSRVAK